MIIERGHPSFSRLGVLSHQVENGHKMLARIRKDGRGEWQALRARYAGCSD